MVVELGCFIWCEYCICVILVDVDYFKLVNDIYGYLVGDDCLKEIVVCIDKNIYWFIDFVVCYGGEEFCIVFIEIDEEGVEIVV